MIMRRRDRDGKMRRRDRDKREVERGSECSPQDF